MTHRINLALNKPACQSSFSHWSKLLESSCAVNGVKTGEYGFHTEKEYRPWFQIDLEEIYSLSSVEIYNRGRAGTVVADRATSLSVNISTDGVNWDCVYAGGVSFGGILDNRPLVVRCINSKARFVRLQLADENYLHLDEVEVYALYEQIRILSNPETLSPSLTLLGQKYGTDKVSHGFCEYYEQAFAAMRPCATKVMEIGVFFGASLCMWRDWFPQATIHGADHFTGQQGNGSSFQHADKFMQEVNAGQHSRIMLHQLDQSNRDELEKFAAQHLNASFDLIVDDASHKMRDQQQTLGALFRLVKPGGYFVIEDLHSSSSSGYDVESDGSNSTLLMIEHALAGCGWQSRYISGQELDFLDQSVDLSQTRIYGSGGSQTCVIRRKCSVVANFSSGMVPGTILMMNYATMDELNQSRQQQQIAWARQWIQESINHDNSGLTNGDVVCFGPNSLDPEFTVQNHRILSIPKGGGYWLWKPYLINSILAATNAEFVIYCDSGSTLIQPLWTAIDIMRASDASVLAFDLTCHNAFEYQWTKGQLLREMKATDSVFSHSGQIATSAFVLRVDAFSKKLVHDWLKLMQNPVFPADVPSADGEGDFPGFIEHRHDQSIYSLLVKKMNYAWSRASPVVVLRDFSEWVGHHHLGMDKRV